MAAQISLKIENFVPEKWRWILQHAGFRRYFSNTSWLFGGQLVSLLLSFFIGAWLARYLGPENYGLVNYAVAFVGLFGFVATLGLDNILNRDLINFPNRRDALLGTAFFLKLGGGFLAFLLASLSAFLISDSSLISALISLFAFSFILQAVNVVSIYFQAQVQAKNNVKVVLGATLLSSLLKVLLIWGHQGVIYLVLIYVLDVFWQGLGFIWAYRAAGLKFKDWQFNNSLAREMLNNSWPLMLAYAAGFIYLKIDQVMVGGLLGDYAVGLYAAAVKLAELWYFVPSIICSSLFPALVRARQISPALYVSRLRSLYALMALLALGVALIMTFLAHPLINYLFGPAYLPAVPVLQIYIWSGIGLFVGTAVGHYLISENLVKTIFYLNFFTMLVNIILNYFWIPRFALAGAAWATFISYLIIPVFILIFRRSSRVG